MASRRLRACAPLFLLFLAPAFTFDPDFSFYPTNAQPCLNQAAKASKCTGATAEDLNRCLCGNGGNFVLGTATCIGEHDAIDAQAVYRTMSGACADSQTPMDVSQSQFYAAVNGQSTTTTITTTSSAKTSATATTTTTANSGGVTVTVTPSSAGTSDGQNDKGWLSAGAIVGIAVGASLGVVAIVAGLALLLLRRKKRRGEEAHPMLSQYGQDARCSAATTFPPTEPSPGLSPFGFEAKRPAWALSAGPSPDPSCRTSGATWDPSQGHNKGPYALSDGAVGLPLQTASQVFEIDGAPVAGHQHQGPVEMQGSLPLSNRNSGL